MIRDGYQAEADRFEAEYAERAGVTVEWLHRWGRWAEPCHCAGEYCEGWAMGHQHEDALFENEMRERVKARREGDRP
jgi:hypothetical protein